MVKHSKVRHLRSRHKTLLNLKLHPVLSDQTNPSIILNSRIFRVGWPTDGSVAADLRLSGIQYFLFMHTILSREQDI